MEGEHCSNHVQPGCGKGSNTTASKDLPKLFVIARCLFL